MNYGCVQERNECDNYECKGSCQLGQGVMLPSLPTKNEVET